ncbi:hypothetical protein [Mesorhizobium sp. M0296]
MMLPDQRNWRFVDISAATARLLAERLIAAATGAEKNAEAVPKGAPQ